MWKTQEECGLCRQRALRQRSNVYIDASFLAQGGELQQSSVIASVSSPAQRP